MSRAKRTPFDSAGPGIVIDPLSLENYLVVLPAYMEESTIGGLVRKLREMRLNVVVVDDGSGDDTARVAEEAGAHVIRLTANQGKGTALSAGFAYAIQEGYDAVETMDADGQHDPDDVLRFFDTYNRTGIPVLIGNRTLDRNRMPFLRRCVNRYMSHLLNRHMSQYIADTQNGFRLYQTDVISMVSSDSGGFAAESEILLQLDEIGIRMGSVPVAAVYRGEHSHIRPLRDTRLFFQMLRRFLRKSRARA